MANKKNTAGANSAPASKAPAKPNSASAKRAAEIAEQHGVDTVYENPKGEFFTVENLAMLSVGKDKKQLTIHRPAFIKGQEPVDAAEEGGGTEGGEGGANGEGDAPPAE